MIYNTKTKNKSFIVTWRYFQDHDVDDPIFMLRLNNKELESFNLDDFKDDDDVERRNIVLQAVIEECKNNVWFFFREVVRIGSSFSNVLGFHDFDSMYILTPDCAALIRAYEKNTSIILEHTDGNDDLYTLTMNLLMLYHNYFIESSWNRIEYGDESTIKNNLSNLKNPSSIEGLINSNYKFFTSINSNSINKKFEDYFSHGQNISKYNLKDYFNSGDTIISKNCTFMSSYLYFDPRQIDPNKELKNQDIIKLMKATRKSIYSNIYYHYTMGIKLFAIIHTNGPNTTPYKFNNLLNDNEIDGLFTYILRNSTVNVYTSKDLIEILNSPEKSEKIICFS